MSTVTFEFDFESTVCLLTYRFDIGVLKMHKMVE